MTIHVEDRENTKNEVIVRQGNIIKLLTAGVVVLLLFSLFLGWLCLERKLLACDNITTDWTGNGKEYCIIEVKE